MLALILRHPHFEVRAPLLLWRRGRSCIVGSAGRRCVALVRLVGGRGVVDVRALPHHQCGQELLEWPSLLNLRPRQRLITPRTWPLFKRGTTYQLDDVRPHDLLSELLARGQDLSRVEVEQTPLLARVTHVVALEECGVEVQPRGRCHGDTDVGRSESNLHGGQQAIAAADVDDES